MGISGALDTFSPYLTNRSFAVSFADFVPSHSPLSCGVPQSYVLGPLLFSHYMLPLSQIINSFNISYHLYANGIQLHFTLNLLQSLQAPLPCHDTFKIWMSGNYLELNTEKTEVLVGPDHINQTIW